MNSNQSSKLGNNGFINFDFDMDDDPEIYYQLTADVPASREAEEVAYTYLNKYLKLINPIKQKRDSSSSPQMKDFMSSPQYIDSVDTDLPSGKQHSILYEKEPIATQEIKFANTHLVKFRQLCEAIPVYGSLATVELDQKNELISISANFGEPEPHKVPSKPKISKQDAKLIALKEIEKMGYLLSDADLNSGPHYYFDSSSSSWRLVYIVETKTKQKSFNSVSSAIPKLVDYIIDAHEGKVISQLPRVKTFTSMSNKTK